MALAWQDSLFEEERTQLSFEGLRRLPAQLQEVRAAVSERYQVDFDSVLVNLYRDGRDGVAWHGDTVRKRLPEAVVVTVGLGERCPRRPGPAPG